MSIEDTKGDLGKINNTQRGNEPFGRNTNFPSQSELNKKWDDKKHPQPDGDEA